MNKKALALSIIAIIISFVGGFLLANALNRKELDELRAESARLKSAPPTAANSGELDLSDEEIKQKIAEADQSSANSGFQKNLAFGLYDYARLKQDVKYLPDIARLLRRAHELDQKDYKTIVTLANVNFDLGRLNKDSNALAQSREFYQKALALKKDDADVQNDLGLTYFLAEPPDAQRAITEYQKALQMNPKHEKSLENLIQANLSLGKNGEASEFLSKLKQVNPNNKALPELEAQIAQSKNK